MKLTDGRGVDCVVEVGGVGTLERSFDSIAAGGKVALIGVMTGRSADINPYGLMWKSGALHGIRVGTIDMFERMNRAIETNGIKPIIDTVVPFDHAARRLPSAGLGHVRGQDRRRDLIVEIMSRRPDVGTGGETRGPINAAGSRSRLDAAMCCDEIHHAQRILRAGCRSDRIMGRAGDEPERDALGIRGLEHQRMPSRHVVVVHPLDHENRGARTRHRRRADASLRSTPYLNRA